jgi:hypothetical protein
VILVARSGEGDEMSHVTYTPQSSQAVGSTPMTSDTEHTAFTTVRKMLDAYAEREVQRIRWSAVIAGLFLSVGSEILLGSFGRAIGVSAGAADASGLLSRFDSSAGVWTTFVALVSTFVGGYAAAKLGGAIRRADGILSGTLTWATSLVVTLTMMLPLASAASLVRTAQSAAAHGDAAKSAWFVFGSIALSLLTAMLGGAAGSVGEGSARRSERARRREMQAQAAQIEVEIEQEQHRRSQEQGR